MNRIKAENYACCKSTSDYINELIPLTVVINMKGNFANESHL